MQADKRAHRAKERRREKARIPDQASSPACTVCIDCIVRALIRMLVANLNPRVWAPPPPPQVAAEKVCLRDTPVANRCARGVPSDVVVPLAPLMCRSGGGVPPSTPTEAPPAKLELRRAMANSPDTVPGARFTPRPFILSTRHRSWLIPLTTRPPHCYLSLGPQGSYDAHGGFVRQP